MTDSVIWLTILAIWRSRTAAMQIMFAVRIAWHEVNYHPTNRLFVVLRRYLHQFACGQVVDKSTNHYIRGNPLVRFEFQNLLLCRQIHIGGAVESIGRYCPHAALCVK